MQDTLELPAELTIYTASATRTAWLAWLSRPGFTPRSSVEINGGQVEEIDGAGVQLLGALTQSLVEQGVAWRVTAPTDVLLQACSALGSQEWLAGAPEQAGRP